MALLNEKTKNRCSDCNACCKNQKTMFQLATICSNNSRRTKFAHTHANISAGMVSHASKVLVTPFRMFESVNRLWIFTINLVFQAPLKKKSHIASNLAYKKGRPCQYPYADNNSGQWHEQRNIRWGNHTHQPFDVAWQHPVWTARLLDCPSQHIE